MCMNDISVMYSIMVLMEKATTSTKVTYLHATGNTCAFVKIAIRGK